VFCEGKLDRIFLKFDSASLVSSELVRLQGLNYEINHQAHLAELEKNNESAAVHSDEQ
jgi:hypothetical protein